MPTAADNARRPELRPAIARWPAAAVVVGAAWFASSWCVHPPGQIDPARGAEIFRRRCAPCHAADPAVDLGYGPNLAEVGRWAGQRKPGLSAEEYLFESILRPAAFRAPHSTGLMPASAAEGLPPRAVADLVAYLATLGGTLEPARVASAAERIDWNIRPEVEPPLRLAHVEAGREIYLGRGRCAYCHPLQRLPGQTLLGPNLLAVGFHERAYLRESLLAPDQHVAPAYREAQITLATGIPLTGRILRDDAQHCLVLVTGEAELRIARIARGAIEPGGIAARGASPMPPAADLSDDDLELLLDFLQTLRY